MLAAWHGHDWGGPWFLLIPLLWIGLIVTLALVFRHRWRPWRGGPAEAALGERYARGEITEQEYRQRLAVLREGSR
jgi:putative membrane protein